jgi:hypothetical protein
MRLSDKGAFFVKKDDGSIWMAFYFKNNYLLKHNKKMMETPLSNKLFAVLIDDKGKDYIWHNSSIKDFEKSITTKTKDLYPYTEKNIYEKMGDKKYTKKWFEDKCAFIQTQLL